MPVFSLKNTARRVFHGAHSRAPLDILGRWNLSGPQPVGDGGVPQWAADLFDSNPSIQRIAVSTDTCGVVWSRIADSDATPSAEGAQGKGE